MDTKHPLFDAISENTVYVRPVDVIELPEEIREQVEGLDHIYAVHDADGSGSRSPRTESSLSSSPARTNWRRSTCTDLAGPLFLPEKSSGGSKAGCQPATSPICSSFRRT